MTVSLVIKPKQPMPSPVPYPIFEFNKKTDYTVGKQTSVEDILRKLEHFYEEEGVFRIAFHNEEEKAKLDDSIRDLLMTGVQLSMKEELMKEK